MSAAGINAAQFAVIRESLHTLENIVCGFTYMELLRTHTLEHCEPARRGEVEEGYEADRLFVAWRELSAATSALDDGVSTLISCATYRPGHRARRMMIDGWPDLKRCQAAAKAFSDLLLAASDQLELPFRSLHHAAEDVEAGKLDPIKTSDLF
jgi:hypothetical protein